MSLLEYAMEDCVMIHKITSDDGYGGEITTWVDGATFQAAFEFNGSTQARIAQAQGAKDNYRVTTHKDKILGYHDVFRRESDGQVFRVTSNGKDAKTPKTAGLNMSIVNAEAWELTDG